MVRTAVATSEPFGEIIRIPEIDTDSTWDLGQAVMELNGAEHVDGEAGLLASLPAVPEVLTSRPDFSRMKHLFNQGRLRDLSRVTGLDGHTEAGAPVTVNQLIGVFSQRPEAMVVVRGLTVIEREVVSGVALPIGRGNRRFTFTQSFQLAFDNLPHRHGLPARPESFAELEPLRVHVDPGVSSLREALTN